MMACEGDEWAKAPWDLDMNGPIEKVLTYLRADVCALSHYTMQTHRQPRCLEYVLPNCDWMLEDVTMQVAKGSIVTTTVVLLT